LQGEEVAYYPLGKVNNVDILYNFPLGDSTITLLGCSNRTDQSIDIFTIHPDNGQLSDITNGNPLAIDTTKIDDIYGFCFAEDKHTTKHYAVINGKNGLMQQFEIIPAEDYLEITLVRAVQFDSQTEGMVADKELGFLYVGEENKGIWKLSITPNDTTQKQLVADSDASNPNIVYDIEGLSLYKTGETTGYLIASSQGNFSYAVFDRTGNNRYLNSFKILDSDLIDGVEETDGLDAVSDSLSPVYP
jgi:3-phytase